MEKFTRDTHSFVKMSKRVTLSLVNAFGPQTKLFVKCHLRDRKSFKKDRIISPILRDKEI